MMHWVAVFAVVLATASAKELKSNAELNLVNANYIFNDIRDSMHQFGNSLNHNGMSIFLATVPEDTELYHGTSHPWRVNGTEWLAFEPEHALLFARGPMKRPPKDPDDGDDGDYEYEYASARQLGRMQAVLDSRHMSSSRAQRPRDSKPGYLHTYRTKHDLRLLYVNGQSAAKSQKGTLDIQDYVLLPEPPRTIPGEWLPFDDLARARNLCRVASNEWQGEIDGVVRMEGGFEIILCDFLKDLDFVSSVQSNHLLEDDEEAATEQMFNYYKAIAARYDGIGGGRVRLDYGDFITLYNHPSAIYFDESHLPRVDNTSTSIPGLRDEVKGLATGRTSSTSTDWQAVTDMVVARYADRISYLASGSFSNLTKFRQEVDRALRPFIDYSARNSTAEIQRCSHQVLPRDHNVSLASRTVLNITTTICSILSSVLSEDVDLSTALNQITELKSWLGWTEWKKCRGCGYHEVCFLPIWPLGSKADFEQPKCRSNVMFAPGGYWWDDMPNTEE